MKRKIIVILLSILFNFIKSKSKKKTEDINLEENEDPTEEENELLTLDSTNYRKYIKTEKFFVLFHNPWCKFSQNLERKLKNVNKLLKMEQQPYYIGSVDCTIEDCKQIISDNFPSNFLNAYISYPKLIFYEKGIPMEIYKGKFNKNDIYLYSKRKIYNESIHLTILPVFELKIGHDKKAFIFFGDFNAADYIQSFTSFNEIARNTTDSMFYHTNDERLYQKLNPEKTAIIVYYTFGKKIDHINLNVNDTTNDINEFVRKYTFVNFFPRMTEDVINEVMIKKQTALILFRSIYDNSTSILEKNFPLIAKSNPELKLVITDLTGKYEMKLAKLLDVSENLPTLRLIDFDYQAEMRKFELTKDLTLENVLSFINNWKENKIQPFQFKLNTQEVINIKDSLVRKISLSNYYDSVIFNRKNAVVFFYTNWCSHCKKLLVSLEAVAKRFNLNLISFYSIDIEESGKSQYIKDIDKVPVIAIHTIRDKEHPIIYFPENFSVNFVYQYIAEKTSLKEVKSDL